MEMKKPQSWYIPQPPPHLQKVPWDPLYRLTKSFSSSVHMRWGLEERITAPASRRALCRQVDFPGLNTAFISHEYFFTIVCCISQLRCDNGQEEAGIEAADRQDCQGIWLNCLHRTTGPSPASPLGSAGLSAASPSFSLHPPDLQLHKEKLN